MNTHEAATALGVSVSNVRNQAALGRLTATKRDGSWMVTAEAVEEYRRTRLGYHPRPTLSPETERRRIAKLGSPETRAKMRAAKLGRSQSREHRENAANARRGKPLTPEHREKVRAAQKGKTLAPDHLDHLRAYHRTRRGKPLPAATRAKLAEAMVRAHREGRRPYSPLENRAAELLVGWERSVLIDGHAFDFGSPDGSMLVEVNGCRWHDHRAIKPECPTHMSRSTNSRDEERRDIARANGRILVELWECEERDWPMAMRLIT